MLAQFLTLLKYSTYFYGLLEARQPCKNRGWIRVCQSRIRPDSQVMIPFDWHNKEYNIAAYLRTGPIMDLFGYSGTLHQISGN